MDTLMVVLKHIVATLPFVVLLVLINKANLKPIHRARQFMMPILALVYCVVMMFMLEKFNAQILLWIQQLTQYIPFLGRLNWNVWLVFISNALMLLIFLAIKSVLLPIFSKIWGGSKDLMESTSGLFYMYDKDVDQWLLQNWCAQLKTYFSGIYYAACIVSVIVFLMSRSLPQWDIFKAQIYPIFCLLIFEEVYAFLSGVSKAEYYEDVFGEDESSYKVANYGMLREILRGLFGDRVLAENVVDNSDWMSSGYASLEKISHAEDAEISSIGKYFSAIDTDGKALDINYINSCINLVKGKSVLFCNPFYRDLTEYILLPVIKKLLRYQNILIIVGRDGAAADVKSWMEENIYQQTNTRDLWKTQILSRSNDTCSIGILRLSDIYDFEIQTRNAEFLNEVGMVLLIEPSRILSSSQIGLNIIAEKCNAQQNVVYCACDRNCDGLIDALSHALNTSITEVTATVYSNASVSQMYWNADGSYLHHRILPNVSHYLGVGTELSAVALRYQLPRTQWISSEKFPVLDMKWIDGQYYTKISHFTNIPNNQEAFNEAFEVETNIWNCEKRENTFLIVEDEFQNLFEMGRVFSGRAQNQNFINIISENYLLRDYMVDHINTFMADPKAIPTVVPDFARTQRNLTIRLIIMMLQMPVSEKYVRNTLALCGFHCKNVYTDLLALIQKYCRLQVAVSVLFKETMDRETAIQTTEVYYAIENTPETKSYFQLFQNAYLIAEDESDTQKYIGAKLFGQVYQTLLPGQFLTVDGKYYEVQTITPENGVILRRAADHITERKYYRQMRAYTLTSWQDDETMAGQKNVSGIEITKGFCNFTVQTEGYYAMSSCEDIANAKKVVISGIPQRAYQNKSVLRIRLPESDAEIRYTICLCLNEIFRTVYPDTYSYISAVTVMPETEDDDLFLIPKFSTPFDEDCIFLLEDNEVDMGLLVSVERNLQRYLEYIAEYLAWHDKKLAEPFKPVEVSTAPTMDVSKDDAPKKRGWFKRLMEKLKKLFGFGRKKGGAGTDSAPNGEPTAETETGAELPSEVPLDEPVESLPEANAESETATAVSAEANAETEPVATEESGASAESLPLEVQLEALIESLPEENAESETVNETPAEANAEPETAIEAPAETNAEPEITSAEDETPVLDEPATEEEPKTPYQQHCFLRFGFGTDLPNIAPEKTVAYLSAFGLQENPLSQARSGEELAAVYEQSYDPKKYGVHFCDFCGVELGGEHEVLRDGRERCNRCSETALKTDEEFRELLKLVERNMQNFFGISLNKSIAVRMTDARKIAKHCGMEFVATPAYDGRVLGFAQNGKDGCSLYIENGSPRIAAAATMAHELTHIWQYANWDDRKIEQMYGKEHALEIYEGMAKWVEIQYLIFINEISYAKREEILTKLREDEYGRGFLLYLQKYPLTYGHGKGRTPFEQNPPI